VKGDAASDLVLVEHMLECLDKIDAYTGRDRARFDGSSLVQDAVLRKLQVLTESSQRLTVETRATEPQQPWRELSGFRNVVVHAYLSIDPNVVWSIIEQDLPPLREALQRLARRLAAVTPEPPPVA
jgi:uncharacterized protein with HEPN domain